MRRPAPRGPDLLPDVDPAVLRVVIALGALAIAITLLRAFGLPVDLLLWRSGAGSWWQPVTSLFVHYPGSTGITQVLIDLLLLVLVLPSVRAELGDRGVLRVLLAGAAGGIVLGAGADALGLVSGVRGGWGSLLWALFLSLGLRGPDRVFRLFWVLPVSGRALVWGSLGLSVLFCVAEPTLPSATGLGTWLGTALWWFGPGPGGRRRSLKRHAATIERELRGLRVIQGGRNADEDVN